MGRARELSVSASQGAWPLLLSPWGTMQSGQQVQRSQPVNDRAKAAALDGGIIGHGV